MKTVGFIGLGTMGKPMAANLLKKGYGLIVYNRSPEKADDLVRAGARRASTPAQAARESEVLITIVSDDAALLETVLGKDGIMEGAHAGLTVIDSSTVAPETSRRAAEALAAHGTQFLDAPVTGSKPAAESGELLFMVGGSKEVLDQHIDVLETMGKKVLHLGGSGSGSYAKLAHNVIVGINSAALAEGMSIAARAGIDAEKFLEIVQSGGAASKQADLKGRKIIEGEFSVQFSLQLMLKDLLLASRETGRFQLPTPLLHSATSLYQMGLSKGNGPLDLSSVVQCYEAWMDRKVGGTTAAAAKTETAASHAAQDQPAADRRRSERVSLDIRLLVSIYQWEREGSFSGQNIEAHLHDLSEDGLQIQSEYPLAEEMFVVIHFPKEATLPPITAKIIRVEADGGVYRYGCMMSGLSPVTKVRLEQYIRDVAERRRG